MTKRAQEVLKAVREYCAAGGTLCTRRWNIKFWAGQWVKADPERPTCPLGAYMLMRQPMRDEAIRFAGAYRTLARALGAKDLVYVTGFVQALDYPQGTASLHGPGHWEEFLEGHKDGLATYDALVAEGLLWPTET